MAAVSIAGASGAAGAAELVGSDLTSVPDSEFVGVVTHTQGTAAPTMLLPLVAPAPGVIVSVKIRHGAGTGTATNAGFSILSGASPTFTARTSPQLPNFVWGAAEQDGTRTFTANPGVPIAAGERLAYRHLSASATPKMVHVVGGATRLASGGSHVSGSASYSPVLNIELLMQMKIEPDVDLDSLGDETQDTTPSACAGLAVTKLGTPGDDTIVGTAGDDVISTGGGDDTVVGLGGNDIVCGGDGNDVLKGGPGKDLLVGEAGKDKLKGGGGKDTCNGGPQKDTARKCEKAKKI